MIPCVAVLQRFGIPYFSRKEDPRKVAVNVGCIKPQYYIDKIQIEYSKFKDNLLKVVENIKSLV